MPDRKTLRRSRLAQRQNLQLPVWFGDNSENDFELGYERMKLLNKEQEPNSAADWFHKRYGSALADEIALPLLEAWSGAPAEDLSPAVGEGLFGGSIAKTLYLKTAGKLTGRAVACGYNREKPETPVYGMFIPRGCFHVV